MWEISDIRYEWMKERVKAALEFMKEHDGDYPAISGYLGIVVEMTLKDLLEMRPSEHGMTDEDLSRLEEKVEAKR